MQDNQMDVQTSKTSLLNNMILRAWRERWSDSEWGINIKTVLPRGVSGDVYNLADCVLQQALVGTNANNLILSYLKHSLCTHMVSYAAVLRRVSKYEHYQRTYCITSLLEFLEETIDGIACRYKPEETAMPAAIISLVQWLIQIFVPVLAHYEEHNEITPDQSLMLDHTCTVIEKVVNNAFILSMLYVGRYEDTESYCRIQETYTNVKTSLTTTNFTMPTTTVEEHLHKLSHIDIPCLEMKSLDDSKDRPETITHCVQPLLAIEVAFNPCNETSYYVTEMQMIKRLKRFAHPRLYYEIIRACFVSLSDVDETSHDTMWSAFTFFSVPHIIKQLNPYSAAAYEVKVESGSNDFIPDVVKAIELLLEDDLLLDSMDAKCNCNIIENLLNVWTNQKLVNEMHVKHFAAQREQISQLLQNGNQQSSIITRVAKAEAPLMGVLKSLLKDSTLQDGLLQVMSQLLSGNSLEMLLSVATVEGLLKTLVSRLIKLNENSKQIPSEVGNPSAIRSMLFDFSFLMLTFIIQVYGSDIILSENGDSFYEKWARECMVERDKPKDPTNMIALCDENIVDELLLSFSTPEAQLKNSNLTLQDICMNLPGVLYQVLIAWETETLSSADVKGILDNIKNRLFCFSVCATSFLCAYMNTVRENELLKPLNMIQELLARDDEMSTQNYVEQRLTLSCKIIRKMQHDVHPSGIPKLRSIALTQNLISQVELEEQFRDMWKSIVQSGWLSVTAAQDLKTLLQAGGPTWLTTLLVEEIVKCKYTRDMMKTMDIVFGVLHLDIERTTEALLEQVIPMLITNRQGEDIFEPQSLVLARLCVYCIISSLETRSQLPPLMEPKKRSRSIDSDENSEIAANTAKIRKLGSSASNPENSDNSCSNDFINETNAVLLEQNNSNSNSNNSNTNNGGNGSSADATAASTVAGVSPSTVISTAASTIATAASAGSSPKQASPTPPPEILGEPLQTSLESIFRAFQQYVAINEISPRIYFVYQFLSLLVELGGERIMPVLRLLPTNLVQNLLKIMMTDDMSVGLIAQLYDMNSSGGRLQAISDLCLWRNIQLKAQSIQL